MKDEKEKMVCKDCNTEMIAGIALVPIWGTLDERPIQNGTTLNMVDGQVEKVLKCSNCGHSVFFAELLIRDQK